MAIENRDRDIIGEISEISEEELQYGRWSRDSSQKHVPVKKLLKLDVHYGRVLGQFLNRRRRIFKIIKNNENLVGISEIRILLRNLGLPWENEKSDVPWTDGTDIQWESWEKAGYFNIIHSFNATDKNHDMKLEFNDFVIALGLVNVRAWIIDQTVIFGGRINWTFWEVEEQKLNLPQICMKILIT
eukprot:UN23043